MFFIICIIFFLLKINSLNAEILSAKFELSFIQEKELLNGKAQFFVNKDGFYTFSSKGIRILKVVQGEKNLNIYSEEKEGFFKVYIKKTKSPLIIFFESELSLKKSPFLRIYDKYLPFPDNPIPFELVIRDYSVIKNFIVVPHEEAEISSEDSALLKFEKPLKDPPPLVVGYDLKKRIININNKEIIFYLDSSYPNAKWDQHERELKNKLLIFDNKILKIPNKRIFVFFSFTEEKVYPFSIVLKRESFKDLPWDSLFSLIAEEIFKYEFNLKDEFLLKALSLYFGAYKFVEDKIGFRRNLLLNESFESKAFFYFYENLDRTVGEDNFDKALLVYYDNFLSNASNVRPFQIFLKDLLRIENFEVQNFEKVSLRVKEFDIIPIQDQGGYKLRILMVREGDPRPLKIGVRIKAKKIIKEEIINLDSDKKIYEFYLSDKPEEILFDPEYKIFRVLTLREILPSLETLYEVKLRVYLPDREFYPLYREVLENLRANIKAISYGALNLEDLPQDNILFLHFPPKGYHQYLPDEGFFFKILPHPFSQEHFIAFMKASSTREIANFLKFENSLKGCSEFHIKGKKIIYKKERDPSQRGIMLSFSGKKSYGTEPAKLNTLEKILPELLSSQIILLGENHEEYSHHLFQLEVIKELHNYYPQLVIGLEMVQAPFQKYLDEFIEGRIDEKKLLNKIEYYERWGFDYRLYRDIFLFAKEKKIKLLALDIKGEIVKKVFKEGIHKLSEEDRVHLPELDLFRPEYRDYLEKVFQSHKFQDNQTNFEYFYQAQVLRDEYMTERSVEFLKKNPSYKMIILVGRGHLEYGYGIPASFKRRNFHNFKSIILGRVEKINPFLADYWFFPEFEEKFEPSPKLGVILEEEKEGLKVKEVLNGSLAEKAGLIAGDLLVKVDENEVKKISDLKIHLTFKNKDDNLRLELIRENKKIIVEIKI